ncbi:diguanylate cyclase [Deinococcus cellulosilyticus]|uniref:GGDEF domain-containing protein n=1 Tax=Deinococcus cellulosilyticus (strain DSM 18568 / NBRC 106333 / KACC 11606 / 5516J-15) TaxID=1223518 RepID=A0A511N5W6_DEIC1|nr:diguanylate cyclase [Deinococcus cellulosilyticus]GEM47857.1 hypothetical protein DC3_34920 [Deinococcus cellulosilyticus NBRC 106333 = KACC 11606]
MNHSSNGHLKPEDHLIRDPLTGAYSRGLLEARLNEELSRAQREQGQLTVCLFDIDHFKSVNDAYGHQRGDEVLIHLVKVVQASLRNSDVLFRYGGDEFVLVLPSTGRTQAEIVCQRIVQQVRSQVLEGQPPLKISISLGLAVFPEDASGSRELLQVADERNYIAKRQGRDQFVSSSASSKPDLHFDAQARPLERDHQLTRFHAFVQKVQDLGGGVFRVAGEAGSGRTFFLNRLEQDFQTRNFFTVRLAPSRPLQHRPYGVFQQLEGLEGPVQPGGKGLGRLLWQQARNHSGLAVVVDNMTLLDWASRALLGRLLQEADGLPVAVVYSQGLQETPPVFPAPQRNEMQVVLTPLSRHAVQVWLREVLSWEAPADLIDWIHFASQGLPARVRQVIQTLIDQNMLQRRGTDWLLDAAYRNHTVLLETQEHALSSTLPVPATHFFGREKEWLEVSSLLEHRRLVTLVGPGGIGKTRLSIEVAELRQDQYPDGVWFVALDTLQSPELVASSIARVLGVKEGRRPLLEDLKDHVKKMSALLVLDNFEQVVDAAPVLDEVLAAAPGVQMLITSREKLNLSCEQVFVVPPLGIPDERETITEEEAYQYSALSLFIDRARAVLPSLELTPGHLKAIQKICLQLDGLPLALELAAASVDLFSPEELAEDLQANRLSLLTEGPRNLAERQKTLRNTIDWSYHLLSEAERWVFDRLAVFVGGWSFEAAQAVCSGFGSRFAGRGLSLQSALMKLASKSLIQFQRAQKRFVMLQTIREYALEKLNSQPDVAEVRRAHALHFLSLGEQAETYLVGDGQAQWLEVLQLNQGNLRAALDWMLRHGETLWAMQLCSGIWKFWQFKTHHQEGRERIAQVLQKAQMALLMTRNPEERRQRIVLQSRLQVAAGWLANDQADHSETRRLFHAALQGFREVADRRGIGLALQGTGEVCTNAGDYAQAMEHFEESRQIMQEIGDLEEYAWVTDHLGRCQQVIGQLGAAEESFTLCIQLFRQLKQEWGESIATIHLADVLVRQTKFDQVLDLTGPWIDEQREKKDTSGFVYALALGWSGEARLHLGQLEAAEMDLREAIDTCNTSGFRLTRIPCILVLLLLKKNQKAEARQLLLATCKVVRSFDDPARWLELLIPAVHLALSEKDPVQATHLLSALRRVQDDFEIMPTPVDAFMLKGAQQHLQTQMGQEAFDRHWQESQETPKKQLMLNLETWLSQA